MFTRMFAGLSLFSLLAGCGGTLEPGVAETHDGLSTISETVVTFLADGTKRVIVNQLSREEADARTEARRRYLEARQNNGVETTGSGLSQDTTCGGASLWLYSGAGETANRICFYGAGTDSLDNYCQAWFHGACLVSWGGNVRSAWAGDSGGQLWIAGSEICNVGFSAWSSPFDLSGCDQGDNEVTLYAN